MSVEEQISLHSSKQGISTRQTNQRESERPSMKSDLTHVSPYTVVYEETALPTFQNETRNGFNLQQHGLHNLLKSPFILPKPDGMVGVPRRSRGCEACKKRRLTCNLERPNCSHCKQEKRDCRFPNSFTFVVNDPGTHKTVYRKPAVGRVKEHDTTGSLDHVQDATTPLLQSSSDPGLLFPNHTNSLDHAQDVTIPPRSSPPDDGFLFSNLAMGTVALTTGTAPPIPEASFMSMPQRISNLLCMQQQLLSHALHRFSTQPTNDTSLIQIWIPTLQNFATSKAPLKSSPLACCAAWLARDAGNASMIDFSRHLYAQGLREVRTALRVPGAFLEDEVLGACLALAVFEVIQCPDECRAAYGWHRRASVNLVKMRGAEKHREGVGHDLFLAVRLHGIFYAFEQRRPNFLCTREWCTVPWQFQPKDDFHRLADILARGPQLLQEADELPSKPPEKSLPALLTILSRLLDIDADLETLYGEFEMNALANGEQLYWEEEEEEEEEEEGEEAPIIDPPSTSTFNNTDLPPLDFPSLRTATLLTLHWSLLTMVWAALSTIHTTLATTQTLSVLPSSPRTTRFKTLAPRTHWLEQVRKITRSVPYCMRAAAGEATGARAPPAIGIALEIVIDVMKDKEGCDGEMSAAMAAREELGRRWVAILLS